MTPKNVWLSTAIRRLFTRQPGQHDSIAELFLGTLCLFLCFVALCFLPMVMP